MTGDRNVDLVRRRQNAADLAARKRGRVKVDVETSLRPAQREVGEISGSEIGGFLRVDRVRSFRAAVHDLRRACGEVDDHGTRHTCRAAMNVRKRRARDSVVVHFPGDGVVIEIQRDERCAESSAGRGGRHLILRAQLGGKHHDTTARE